MVPKHRDFHVVTRFRKFDGGKSVYWTMDERTMAFGWESSGIAGTMIMQAQGVQAGHGKLMLDIAPVESYTSQVS